MVTYCDSDVGHTSVTNREILHVLTQLDNGAYSLVPGDELLEWWVRDKNVFEAHTYWERGDEFALVDVAVCTANT